ncbi:MAG TPA: glycosyltransferase 87 family protein [Actinomycetota bacterium]|nr:glycosyltransferase 87 family protein [Actinomycetota bacterium]
MRARERSTLVIDVLVACAVLAASLIPMFIWRYNWHVPIDLGVYRAGGDAVIHGKTLYGHAFGAHFNEPIRLPFTYPPFAAIVFVLLEIWPWQVAMVGWFIISFFAFGYLVREGFRPFIARFSRHRLLVIGVLCAVLLWIVSVTDTLWFGQVNLVLAAVVLFDLLRIGRGRGVLTGIATAIKITPGLFIVYLFVSGQRRAAARALVAMAVCWGGAALLLPSASAKYFFHDAFKVSRPGPPAFFSNQTIDGFISRYGGPHWLWIPVGLLVGAYGLSRARRAHEAGDELTAIVLVGLTTLLIAPISWFAAGVWIVLVIGLLLGDGRSRRRAAAAVVVFALFCARLGMLGEKVVRVWQTPVFGHILESAYVYVYAALLIWLPVRTRAPETEVAEASRPIVLREAG